MFLLAFGSAGPMSRELWTGSHVVLLAGAVLLLPAALRLRTILPRADRLHSLASGSIVVGLFALAGQFAIDLAVGQLAASPSERAALFSTIRSSTFLSWTFYLIGPSLLFAGLLSHGVGLLRSGALAVPGALLVASVIVIGLAASTRVELFLPGYALLLAALAPVGWRDLRSGGAVPAPRA